MMCKQFTVQGNAVWYNILDDLVDKYNDPKHSSIIWHLLKLVKRRHKGIVYFVRGEFAKIRNHKKPIVSS